jgi:nucleoside diphosphate kinase
MTNQTLILIKPDGLKKSLTGNIYKEIFDKISSIC